MGRGGEDGQAERVQPLLSLGAYDIEQQRQSIRSNIQQAPAQWIVARGRRGERGEGTVDGGVREVYPRSKAAHAGSPWITALIESLSDVPWSRVILLPKQLLSSVVYSHLFHPAEPEPQNPGRHFTPRPAPPCPPTSDTYDLARSLSTAPPSQPFGQNSHRLVVLFYRRFRNPIDLIRPIYSGREPSFCLLPLKPAKRRVVWTH